MSGGSDGLAGGIGRSTADGEDAAAGLMIIGRAEGYPV